MYTYHISSVYLDKPRIHKYFSEKDWVEADEKDKNVTLLYLDYWSIKNRKYWSYHSKIKNLIGDDKKILTDKINLDIYLQKRFALYTYPYEIGQDLTLFKGKFEKGKKYIIKPDKGWGGIGVKIVKNYTELNKFFDFDVKKIDFKGIKDRKKWVIQEYLENPLLYKNRKFHLRVYFIIVEKDIYYYDKYLIITGEKEYTSDKDFDKEGVHIVHYKADSIRNKIFPEDFDELEYIDGIKDQIRLLFKNVKRNLKLPMRCYPEDDNCYELLAADILITTEGNIKVMEFNHNVGYPQSLDKRYPLFENGLDIVLNHYGYLDKEKMSRDNYYNKV